MANGSEGVGAPKKERKPYIMPLTVSNERLSCLMETQRTREQGGRGGHQMIVLSYSTRGREVVSPTCWLALSGSATSISALPTGAISSQSLKTR